MELKFALLRLYRCGCSVYVALLSKSVNTGVPILSVTPAAMLYHTTSHESQ
jgi:hypothetical protein